MGVGIKGCARALTRFFSLLHEVRSIRKPRNLCHVQRCSCERAELWRASTLLLRSLRLLSNSFGWCDAPEQQIVTPYL